MNRKENHSKRMRKIGIAITMFSSMVLTTANKEVEAVDLTGSPTHIGTFEGATTYAVTSTNGVRPGLFLEVMDKYGAIYQYESDEGVITIPETQEGNYVTQAKIMGNNQYVDQDTGEILDQWETGRKLKMVSVENPTLFMMGKNWFNGKGHGSLVKDSDEKWVLNDSNWEKNRVQYQLKPHTTYTLTLTTQDSGCWVAILIDGVSTSAHVDKTFSKSFTTDETGKVTLGIYANTSSNIGKRLDSIQLEEGDESTPYVPYRTNQLTLKENVVLRRAGKIYDSIDLITNEWEKAVDTLTLNGSETWTYESWIGGFYVKENRLRRLSDYAHSISTEGLDVVATHKVLAGFEEGVSGFENADSYLGENWIYLKLKGINSLDALKNELTHRPLTLFFEAKEVIRKEVGVNFGYYFAPVKSREVYVDGTILPLLCSITVPTEALTFVLNPNEEYNQQFVAPEFNLTNETTTSIDLAIQNFEQVGNVLNDVLPSAYNNWTQLDKTQSKDIALALVPKPSEGWLSLIEGPRYVADDSNYVLGKVKARSEVVFTFEALHGQAFTEGLNPRYRLVFVFDF